MIEEMASGTCRPSKVYPGYRLYMGRDGARIINLLGGRTKEAIGRILRQHFNFRNRIVHGGTI